MALFRRNRPAPSAPVEERGVSLPGGLWAPSPGYYTPTAGQAVTLQSSLRDAATWACQRVLVSTISMLPVHAYRETDGRLSQLQTDPMLVRNPSGRVSRRGWVAQCVRSGVQSGNIYGRVVATNAMGLPTQIETIDPGQVSWLDVDGAEVPFINGVAQTLWPLGDFWHVPISQFLIAGSRVALSPTEYGATAIGTSLAAEKFGADFFGDSGHPLKTVKVNANIDASQAASIKQGVLNATRGNREPFVHGSDIELGDWAASLKDSELIDLLQFEVLQACRRLGVPPTMVYAAISGQNITYSNVSQADLQFLKYSVQAWVQDLEDAWSDLCAMPHMVKFNTDAVLRMDAISRAQLHEVRLRTKTRTVNEVRDLEDEERFKDPIYDQPGVPTDPAASMPAVDPNAGRALEEIGEIRSMLASQPKEAADVHHHITVNTPEQRFEHHITNDVHVPEQRTEPPVVNVTNEVNPTPVTNEVRVDMPAPPEPKVPDVVVNVTNEVSPTPVTVDNTVNVPADGGSRKTVTYDSKGRVAEIIEEPL